MNTRKRFSPLSRQALDVCDAIEFWRADHLGSWYIAARKNGRTCVIGSSTDIFFFPTVDDAMLFLKRRHKRAYLISQLPL